MIPKDELILMKSNAFADEALKQLIRDNKSRIFVYENREKMIPTGRLELEVEVEGSEANEQEIQKQKQKLIGLINKTDILNVMIIMVAVPRSEFTMIKSFFRSTYDCSSKWYLLPPSQEQRPIDLIE
jgi:hypothetical protein